MKKQIALITGANQGIGLEIARQLGAQGYRVVLGARDLAKGEAAAASLRAAGTDARALRLDVSRAEDVAGLPAAFPEGLDVLINNAGVALWTEDSVDAFRRTFEANVFGVVAVTYALLPLLRESHAGRIVNQSSVLGSLATLTTSGDSMAAFINPAYTASKAALNGFTVALAAKLKGSRVKVNSAHPGWVRTALGGQDAPLDVAAGAKTAVTLATLPDDGPTGGFYHMGEKLPW